MRPRHMYIDSEKILTKYEINTTKYVHLPRISKSV